MTTSPPDRTLDLFLRFEISVNNSKFSSLRLTLTDGSELHIILLGPRPDVLAVVRTLLELGEMPTTLLQTFDMCLHQTPGSV